MSRCIYCEESGKLTREHVFPDFLEQKSDRKGLYFSAAAEKFVESAPVVRDVCRNCNNVVLGALDDYASKLYDRYFAHSVVGSVNFQCDPTLLTRWLLKVMFNGQRAFGGVDKPFWKYRSFILGAVPQPTNTVFLFGGVLGPSIFDGKLVFPRDYRLSDLRLDERMLGVELEIAHMLILNSFMLCAVSLKSGDHPPDKLLHTLRNRAGLTQFDSQGGMCFDPDMSRIDHVSHKVNQTRNRPWLFGRNGEVTVGDKTIKITNHPQIEFAETGIRDNKLSLMTIDVDGRLFATIGFRTFPSRLREIQLSLGDDAPASSRGFAFVERRRYKTYVKLVDPAELDRPHLNMPTGIEQSEENWQLWRSAMEETGLIYLSEGVGKVPGEGQVLCAVPVVSVRHQQ